MKRRSRYVRQQLPDSKALLAQLLSVKKSYRGIAVNWSPKGLSFEGGTDFYADTRAGRHALLRQYISMNPTTYGNYIFERPVRVTAAKRRAGMLAGGFSPTLWKLRDHVRNVVAVWACRPTRVDIAQAIKEARRTDSRPSYRRPDTLGWRAWPWDSRRRCLVSPHTGHAWDTPELRVEAWSSAAAVRGQAGIHACRLPRGDWKMARRPHDMPAPAGSVLGLVERYGKAVVGTEGWRAEWVFVKELLAPDEVTARQIRAAYPDIPCSVAHKGHWLRGE